MSSFSSTQQLVNPVNEDFAAAVIQWHRHGHRTNGQSAPAALSPFSAAQ
ncbi:hypothetical protein [Actinoplanes sp. NPDC051859]